MVFRVFMEGFMFFAVFMEDVSWNGLFAVFTFFVDGVSWKRTLSSFYSFHGGCVLELHFL